ncbi:hypothetical protein TUM4641_17710 [Shewanella morhuae]|nr:hypothetical protein TUM4641_17710 [Shewanella morhuae]
MMKVSDSYDATLLKIIKNQPDKYRLLILVIKNAPSGAFLHGHIVRLF